MAAIDFRIQTPMRRVRGLGSAKSGTEHFWLQRVTALANLLLSIAFVFVVIALSGRDYESARQLLSRPVVGALMALFVVSGCAHMRIGMQVVIEDYLHGAAKVAAVVANIFFAIAVGAACLFALAKLALGS